MPRHFEDFYGATPKALKWLEWLAMELMNKHLGVGEDGKPLAPITAKLIGVATSKNKFMTQTEVRAITYLSTGVKTKLIRLHWQGQDKDLPLMVRIKGVSDVEVRSMVHYLRHVWKFPIGSGSNGYWWVSAPTGMITTMEHLTDRRTALDQDIDACKYANYKVNPLNMFNRDAPVQPGSQISLGDGFGHKGNTPWGLQNG